MYRATNASASSCPPTWRVDFYCVTNKKKLLISSFIWTIDPCWFFAGIEINLSFVRWYMKCRSLLEERWRLCAAQPMRFMTDTVRRKAGAGLRHPTFWVTKLICFIPSSKPLVKPDIWSSLGSDWVLKIFASENEFPSRPRLRKIQSASSHHVEKSFSWEKIYPMTWTSRFMRGKHLANLVEICPSVRPSFSPFLAASLIPRLLISPRSRSLSKSLARRSNERGTNAHYQYAEQSQTVRSLSRPRRENVEQARGAWIFLGSCSNRLRWTHATSWGILVLMSEHPSSLSCSSRVWGKQNMHQPDRQHLNVTMKSIRCRVTFLLRVFL